MNKFRFFPKWGNLYVYLFASNLLLIIGGVHGSFSLYATSSSCQGKVDQGLLEEGPAVSVSEKKSVSLWKLCSGSPAFLLPAWICLATLMHRSRSERDTWTSYNIEFIAVTSGIFPSTIVYACAAQHKCIYLSHKVQNLDRSGTNRCILVQPLTLQGSIYIS